MSGARSAVIKLSVPGRVWGPAGDHTLCAMVHDLRVCARYARTQHGQLPAVTRGNAIPLLTGGQVVAGPIVSARRLSARHCQPDTLSPITVMSCDITRDVREYLNLRLRRGCSSDRISVGSSGRSRGQSEVALGRAVLSPPRPPGAIRRGLACAVVARAGADRLREGVRIGWEFSIARWFERPNRR
jgi:hypothetical protein